MSGSRSGRVRISVVEPGTVGDGQSPPRVTVDMREGLVATALVEVRRRAVIVDEIAEVAPVVVDGAERFGYGVSKGGKVPLTCVSDRRSFAPADHAVSTLSCRGQLCCCCRSLGHLIHACVRRPHGRRGLAVGGCVGGKWENPLGRNGTELHRTALNGTAVTC